MQPLGTQKNAGPAGDNLRRFNGWLTQHLTEYRIFWTFSDAEKMNDKTADFHSIALCHVV